MTETRVTVNFARVDRIVVEVSATTDRDAIDRAIEAAPEVQTNDGWYVSTVAPEGVDANDRDFWTRFGRPVGERRDDWAIRPRPRLV